MRVSQENNRPTFPTGLLVLADGTIYEGEGFAGVGSVAGEVCFNTAMTGYQEILTDPSYASQIITFTFPHIGNVGVNPEDIEDASTPASTAARGAIVRERITAPSNYRSVMDMPAWMKRRGIIGLSGIDTRALTARIRDEGMPHGVIAHDPSGRFDIEKLTAQARAWSGLEGADLAREVTTHAAYVFEEASWQWNDGYTSPAPASDALHIVVMDFGVKKNILRLLVSSGCRVTVVPAKSSLEDIMELDPDGVLLSNGPGDPAATGDYAVPVIKGLIEKKIPTLGICLGHQMLALAAGARTIKMSQGHHGANHPVKDHQTGKVEIVSMNHGFTVDESTLPENVTSTHVSLFDGTNSGIALKDAPAFSVQHHPEASPGPQDSYYLFDRFVEMIRQSQV